MEFFGVGALGATVPVMPETYSYVHADGNPIPKPLV